MDVQEENVVENTPASLAKPSAAQRRWLTRGLDQPGGKLPLFDGSGQKISSRTVKSCIEQGWAEPWFDNPIKPDWEICKLTESGRNLLSSD
ncbi:MAG: hypothetical protein VYE18_03870 [Pseudomonadota bacterium]|nr:hypothetical protein [Pseudomonadota bacterium]